MKKLFRILLLVISFSFNKNITNAQLKPFELSIQTKGLKTGQVEIMILSITNDFFQIKNRKVPLDNGNFKFAGKLSYPLPVQFFINDSLLTDIFFIEQGKSIANLEMDSLNNLAFRKVSELNDLYKNEYLKKMNINDERLNSWDKEYSLLVENFNGNIPSYLEDSLQELKNSIRKKADSTLYEYIVTYINSYISLWSLYNIVERRGYNSLLSDSYFCLDKKLQKTSTGISIKKLLDIGKRTMIGSIFPTISVRDSSYKKLYISKANYKKYTLIDFWFSHCGPCIEQFPQLKKVYAKFTSRGFEILAISVDKIEDKADWLNAIKTNNLLWPQYWDINYVQAIKLGVTAFPRNFLLDENGKIIYKNIEPAQLELFLLERIGR